MRGQLSNGIGIRLSVYEESFDEDKSTGHLDADMGNSVSTDYSKTFNNTYSATQLMFDRFVTQERRNYSLNQEQIQF